MDYPQGTIWLNGTEYPMSSGTRLSDLLAQLQTPVRHVAVEVNEALIPRQQHADYELQPGDRVEIVTLVGGG